MRNLFEKVEKRRNPEKNKSGKKLKPLLDQENPNDEISLNSADHSSKNSDNRSNSSEESTSIESTQDLIAYKDHPRSKTSLKEVAIYLHFKKYPDQFNDLDSKKKKNAAKTFRRKCFGYCLQDSKILDLSRSRLFKRKVDGSEIIPFIHEIPKIIKNFHAPRDDHKNVTVTLNRIKKSKIFWFGMKDDILKFISECEICKRNIYGI